MIDCPDFQVETIWSWDINYPFDPLMKIMLALFQLHRSFVLSVPVLNCHSWGWSAGVLKAEVADVVAFVETRILIAFFREKDLLLAFPALLNPDLLEILNGL